MAALIPVGMKALGFVGKHWSWFAMGALALTLAIDHARLTHAKADLTKARTEIAAQKTTIDGLRASVVASEGIRATEYANAKQAVSDAQSQCDAQVAEARRSQRVIRQIVEKPVVIDPQTHCPVPDRIGSDELRNALQPAR